MKVPLRYQITLFDCATVSLTNAISFLLEREEIPAELIKFISIYTLDCVDKEGNPGQGGTSREALSVLINWINNFSCQNDFDLVFKKIEKKDVKINIIKKTISEKGIVIARVWQGVEHYVIITKIDNKNIYIFDPFYLNKSYYDKDEEVKIIFSKPFSYNRKVSIKRFLSRKTTDFSLGEIKGREIVLINRNSLNKK